MVGKPFNKMELIVRKVKGADLILLHLQDHCRRGRGRYRINQVKIEKGSTTILVREGVSLHIELLGDDGAKGESAISANTNKRGKNSSLQMYINPMKKTGKRHSLKKIGKEI